MIDITLSGVQIPERSVRLSLPATQEQMRQAFSRLTEGLPTGTTFSYQIAKADSDFHLTEKHIHESSDVDEVNLLAYMLENIKKDFRDLYLNIADSKNPQELPSFINALAAVKSGWYKISDELDGHNDGKLIDGKYVHNFDTSPDIYRSHFVNDWLDAERREYEQRQAESLIQGQGPDESPKIGGMTI